MAIKNIKCPNCGGEVQMDDSLEKGFCMYCGGAILVQEEIKKVKIEHTGKVEISGKVEIDDSKRMNNYLELADRSFDVGNYKESYSYYSGVLECDTENRKAILRKGLCAAYISYTRMSELNQSINTVMSKINSDSENKINETYLVFGDVMEYIKTTYSDNCKHSRGFTYPNLTAANLTFSIIAYLTNLCGKCADIITNDIISLQPTLEDSKKECLELGIEICKMGLSSFRYLSGYRQEKKRGNYVTEPVYESVQSSHKDTEKIFLQKFNNDYNDLPSIRNAIENYDAEMEKQNKNIRLYNRKLQQYFAQNPDKDKAYHKKYAWPFIIIAAVGFVLFAIISPQLQSTSSVAIMFLDILCFVAFSVCTPMAIVKGINGKKLRKRILENLPAELIELKKKCEENEKILRRAKRYNR